MRKRIGCLLAGSLLLLLLLCGGVAAWLYMSSQSRTRAFVQIRAPENGQLTEINQTLLLDVYAEASRPVLRLEVYADGALVAAANGNNRSLSLAQPWTVTTPGRHALVARAFFAADDFADSQVVFVDTVDLSGVPIMVNVDDLPRGEGVTEVRVGDLAAAAGTTPEEIAHLNPGLPAAPGAPIPPGTPLRLPRRPSPPPVLPPPPVPPPAPGAPGMDLAAPPPSRFEGETHSCSQISMRWSDSPDETAYRLYRIAPGEGFMTLIATLPANTLTYTDTVTRVGTYRYFLVPVRPGGESITSMLSVEIGPECAPAGSGTTISLNLFLISLTTQEAYDGVYCYTSFNGSRYERLPAEPNLLLPTSADRLVYDLPLQLPSRGRYSITVPSDGLVRLEGECWGRRGAESLRIGRFSGSHAEPEWDGRDLITGLWAFEPRLLASSQGVPPNAGGASFIRYRIQRADSRFEPPPMPDVLGSITPGIFEAIERNNLTIPSPTNLRIVSFLGSSLLSWDWSGNAAYTEADITGWRVDVSLYGDVLRTSETWAYEVPRDLSTLRLAPMPAIPSRYICGVAVRVTVTALTDRGESPPSAPLEYTAAPPCRVYVRARIESFTIRPSARTGQVRDDGDICILCDDRQLELDKPGSIRNSTARAIVETLRPIEGVVTGCPTQVYCMTEGTYQVPPNMPTYSFGWWVFSISDNSSISFEVQYLDYDLLNSPDPFLIGRVDMPARSPEEWLRTDERLTLTSDFGEAVGEVVISIRGYGAP